MNTTKWLKQRNEDTCPAGKSECGGLIAPDDLPNVHPKMGDMVHEKLCINCEYRGTMYISGRGMTIECRWAKPSEQVDKKKKG